MTFVTKLNLPENDNQSTISSPLDTSPGSPKQPAIRILAGPLRLTPYRAFPILLDANDPLVQESETQDSHLITFASPQHWEDTSTPVNSNGVKAWANQIRERLSALAVRATAHLRRALDQH